MGDQSITPTHRTKQTQTSMPQAGFEPMAPVFKQVKTVHALDCMATVIGDRLVPAHVKSLVLDDKCKYFIKTHYLFLYYI
jgi:hypothetical protein